MWSEWLVRTLRPRGGEDADPAPRPRERPPSERARDDTDEYGVALAEAEESE